MPDLGNAVTARWTGPAGHQLYDGTILVPGVIVEAIGYDEANGNPYWEIVTKLGKGDVPASNADENRTDWSFGVEDGGEGTGRPLTAEQVEPAKSLPAPPADPADGAGS